LPDGLGLYGDVRGKLVVVIFGPYQPPEAKARITGLRDHLRGLGYSKANLVEDMQTPSRRTGEHEDSYIRRKSLYWVENCDVGFMVYAPNCDCSGVTTELNHLSAHAMDRMWRFTVFLDTARRPSSLIRGLLFDWKQELNTAYYSSQTLLNGFGEGLLPDYLFKLGLQLKERPS
jgi:hypothetical protein